MNPVTFDELSQATSTEQPTRPTSWSKRVNEEGIDHARIVIIDDDDLITSMMQTNLTKAGFKNVYPFNDPLEGLRFIGNFGADVLLLDLRMPKTDGIKVLNFLRDQKATLFLPVIILTSADDEETKLQALESGANDYLTKPVHEAELVQRLCNTLAFQKHTGEIQDRVDHIEKELRVDPLTQLNNRRAFDELLPRLFEEAEMFQFSLTLLDIDRFGRINESYGRETGDTALRKIGGIVKSTCGPEDLAFRIGGDVFAILTNHKDPEYPSELAEKMHDAIRVGFNDWSEISTKLTASFGIATHNGQLRQPSELFNTADAALYQSKRRGRNQISCYSEVEPVSEFNTQVEREFSQEKPENVREGKILIVDDEPIITQLLEVQLGKSGYKNVSSENDSTRAIDVIQQQQPDLVILDVRMPVVDGMDILRQLKSNKETNAIPVLIMTSSTDEVLMLETLQLQASDFLTKPANPAELEARVFNSLKLKKQHDRLVHLSEELSKEIEIRTAELYATRRESIFCLARAAETRDQETGNHIIRVGRYSALIAREMGMDEDFISWIELAAQLHDVGKLAIPDAILRKPGQLTDAERKVIETHCDNAADIFFGSVSDPQENTITSPLLKMAERIASTHHEKWDGSGYPHGLAGENIPIEGRITAVADVFDALSSNRAYKKAIEIDECLKVIKEGRGIHFDPVVVDAFLNLRTELFETYERLKEKDQGRK